MSTIDEYRSRLQRAAVRIGELSTTIDTLRRRTTEPIAVIGMGCRFPCGGNQPATFWQALLAGVDGVRKMSSERIGWLGLSAEAASRFAFGSLDEVDGFDASFFGISAREAAQLDPQQRLLLEVAWEALERAGQPAERLQGSKTGVFLGMTRVDYLQLIRRTGRGDTYGLTGNLPSTAAGRIAYVLGLHGPCMTVDTACSSSLVAVHLACQSLRLGESDLGLAGGSNLTLDAGLVSMFDDMHVLSSSGRCRTFDAGADGIAGGEGCGFVVLKRLSDAERDGDPILALIRAAVINQDGRSTGLTAPSVSAQVALLRKALESAGVQPGEIGYVETHGTGTPLGDPIEFEALRQVLGASRADDSRCVLGAMKTNTGHMDAASGVGGLIKAVLCLQHGVIPRNLHFEKLNPHISLDGTPFVIPTENQPWERGDKPRRAGVSGFGISGTNAHVVLEEAPLREPTVMAKEASSVLLPLSAKSPEALVALATAFRETLAHADVLLSDIVSTASLRRTHHAFRLGIVGATKQDLLSSVELFLRGEKPAGLAQGSAPVLAPKVVFVFPGQGSQWVGMGRKLLVEERVFRECMEACDAAIQSELGFSVLEQLGAEDSRSRLNDIDVVQPALFAIEVSLAALWQSWGITPDAVVGHSMGEVAAAYVAGALSLKDATAVICRRSRLLRRLSGQGAMALVELGLAEAERALLGYEDRLSIAVSNGPRSTVLAGDPAALEDVITKLEGKGIFCQRVKVDVAAHSPQMEPLRAPLLAALSDLSPKRARVPIMSTVTGAQARGEEFSAAYWVDNLRKPVLFSQVVRGLVESGHALFIEMSPHPVLVPAVDEALTESGAVGAALSSLRWRIDDRRSLLDSLARLYVHGVSVDWARLYPERGRVVDLPTYPWQHKKYWIDQTTSAPLGEAERALGQASRGPLGLGNSFSVSSLPSTRFWDIPVGVDQPFPLSERRVGGSVVVPWSIALQTCLAAVRRSGDDSFLVEDVVFRDEPTLQDRERLTLQLALTSTNGDWTFSLANARAAEGNEGGAWRTLSEGRIRKLAADVMPREGMPGFFDALTALGREMPTQLFYARLARHGFSYGSGLRVVKQAWARPNEAVGHLSIPDELRASFEDGASFWVLLDGLLQLLHAALPADMLMKSSFRIASFGKAYVFGACPAEMRGIARLDPSDPMRASLLLLDDTNRIVVEIVDIRLEATVGQAEQVDLDQPATVERILRGIYRQVTGSGGTDVDIDLPLNQAGVDSLMYVQILRRAEQAMGVVISTQSIVRSGVSLEAFTLRSLIDLVLGIRRDALASLSSSGPAFVPPKVDDFAVVEALRVEREAEVPEAYRALFGDEIPIETFLATLSSGEQLEVLCAGAGAPLLLLLPMMASIPIWVYQIESFFRDYRVIVPNYPGYGRSTAPTRVLSPARMARRMTALLEGLGIHEPVHLVGWSLGGLVGQELALSLPHKLRSLSLVNTIAHLEEEDSIENMEDLLRRMLVDLNGVTDDDAARRTTVLEASQRDAGMASSLAYMLEAFQFDSRERLCGISVPTFVVQGLLDTVAVPRYGHFMKQEIPRVRYEELENVGHFAPLHQPGVFNDLLRRFLRDV